MNLKLNGPALFLLIALACPLRAQVDLSGSWAARNYEDQIDKVPGPHLIDYAGLPLNAAGRQRALSYSPSMLSMPERVCLFYPQYYMMMGPFGLKIWNETDPDSGNTIAWKINGWEDRSPITIWMDGRPHPSQYAPHEKTGFSTGVWQGDTLIVSTTHMKAGYVKRNGAPLSDEATMTEHFMRHGDLLTVTAQLEDPIYLEEPMFWSRTWQLDSAPIAPVGPPCIRGEEGPEEGVVPHFLPGKNPFINELTQIYGLPTDAILGGAETMYPEFRKKIKDKYVRPKSCLRDCGGPGRGAGPAPAPPPAARN